MQVRVATTVEQREVWLAEHSEGHWNLNVPVYLDFRGRIESAVLRDALLDVVRRHAQLRSRFDLEDGELVQDIQADPAIPWRIDVASVGAPREVAFAQAILAAARPMRLSAGVLRSQLFAYDGGFILCLVTHHIVADGWSVDILVRDLLKAYRARLAGNDADLGAEYQTASVSQTAGESNNLDAAAVEYWSRALDVDWTWLAPRPDLARASVAQMRLEGTPPQTLSPEAQSKLYDSLADNDLSPVSAILAAWALVLTAWCRPPALGLIGLPFSGRNRADTHEEVGLYARVMPIVVDLRNMTASLTRWSIRSPP
jgi:hypothetical protein